jgi:hypothetical protein
MALPTILTTCGSKSNSEVLSSNSASAVVKVLGEYVKVIGLDWLP